MTSEAFAPAKINLTLHVTGQRADGYHLLDSLVVFADVGDRLTFTPAQRLSLTVTGPFADGVPTDSRNLVWRAAELAGKTCHITLEKNLPHGAGIGGGSSDAAAVLRHFDVTEGAATLGADVPVCLRPKAQRMRGIGEVLEPVCAVPRLFALLVNPQAHVPTPSVFKALPSKDNPPMPDVLPDWSDAADFTTWLACMRNDLEAPAIEVAPQIGRVLNTLRNSGDCRLARMSGSGSTCFAICEDPDAARRLCDEISVAHPHWWTKVTTFGQIGPATA